MCGEGTNKVIPAPAPTESTQSTIEGHYGDIQDTNPLGDVVDNPDIEAQTKVRFGDDPDNMGATGDSRFAAVPKSKGTQDSSGRRHRYWSRSISEQKTIRTCYHAIRRGTEGHTCTRASTCTQWSDSGSAVSVDIVRPST